MNVKRGRGRSRQGEPSDCDASLILERRDVKRMGRTILYVPVHTVQGSSARPWRESLVRGMPHALRTVHTDSLAGNTMGGVA